MRKQFGLVFALLGFATIAQASTDSGNATGKTFFNVRPLFQSAMPEKEVLFRDRALAKDCGWGGALQFVAFGGKTSKEKDLAKYFTFCNKDTLAVDSTQANFPDVNPTHFNVHSSLSIGGRRFSSTIQFRPRQTVAGLGLTWRQYLHSPDACEKHWWLELSGPVYHVKNDMRLTETGVTTIGAQEADTNKDMLEAFKGGTRDRDIKNGKIDGSRKKTGFADLEIKLGYDWLCEETCHAEGWIGVLVPTGNKPKGEYLFEPVVGHNKHFGLMWGMNYGYELWSECEKYLHFEVAVASKYLFKNDEKRLMDLKFRPWTRYILMYENATDAGNAEAKNGSEFMLRKFDVTPRFQFDINTGLVYSSCGLQAEIGHNFWFRQAEKVKLANKFEEGIAVASLATPNIPQPDTTNLLSNIGNNNIDGETGLNNDSRIKESDLDLASATHPCAISHIIYGSLGYRWDDMCYPVFLGVGASYEFGAVNTILTRWTVWGKFGVSY